MPLIYRGHLGSALPNEGLRSGNLLHALHCRYVNGNEAKVSDHTVAEASIRDDNRHNSLPMIAPYIGISRGDSHNLDIGLNLDDEISINLTTHTKDGRASHNYISSAALYIICRQQHVAHDSFDGKCTSPPTSLEMNRKRKSSTSKLNTSQTPSRIHSPLPQANETQIFSSTVCNSTLRHVSTRRELVLPAPKIPDEQSSHSSSLRFPFDIPDLPILESNHAKSSVRPDCSLQCKDTERHSCVRSSPPAPDISTAHSSIRHANSRGAIAPCRIIRATSDILSIPTGEPRELLLLYRSQDNLNPNINLQSTSAVDDKDRGGALLSMEHPNTAEDQLADQYSQRKNNTNQFISHISVSRINHVESSRWGISATACCSVQNDSIH